MKSYEKSGYYLKWTIENGITNYIGQFSITTLSVNLGSAFSGNDYKP